MHRSNMLNGAAMENHKYAHSESRKLGCSRAAAKAALRLGGGAEVLLPVEREATRLALEAPLGRLGELVHHSALLLHDLPRRGRAVGRLVATGRAREAAVGVAHGRFVVALEGVEVVVVTRLLRVPGVEDSRLPLNAPDVVVLGAIGEAAASSGGRRSSRGRGRRSSTTAAVPLGEVVSEGLSLVDGLLLALRVIRVDHGRRRVASGLATAEALALAHGNLGHRPLGDGGHEGRRDSNQQGNEEETEHDFDLGSVSLESR
mmetsp:Transcript_13818/g.27802  ORF Transcript_13818/g.27802 Transcript_13818/m.27802 type:complete len:260 (-) Transcript_13818:13-792(-)